MSPSAIDDLDQILQYQAEQSDWDRSMDIEERLFAAFERLGENPGIGHRRPDLTSLPLFFFSVGSHLIVHRRDTEQLQILAVVHSSRNVRRFLRDRVGSKR